MNINKPESVTPADLSRRSFLKHSSLAVAGVAAVSFPSVLRAQAKQPLNAVVIGMGGRGGGAGKDFLSAAKQVGVEAKILAVADLFADRAKGGTSAYGVPAEKCFTGFDSYLKAINEPGVNYVIIASPPGFKPPQFKAAIEAGKHVFTEKPVATDGPGCRIMYEAGKLADQKGLKVAAGTQRRHQAGYVDTIKRIHDGAIGDIVSLRIYWVNGGPIWHRGDKGDTVLEKQIRNWYHYVWLCGDHICEQHVHNIDIANWIMKDHPVKAWGQGSRQQLEGKSGEIWDNFAVEFEYANGVHAFSYCGQIKRSGSPGVDEFAYGTKGMAKPGGSIRTRDGESWRSSLKFQDGPYVQEHIHLIQAILNNTELNETKNVTDSTLTAILGREAAYSGAWVEWDQVLNSKFQYGPEQLYTDCSKMQFGDFRTLKPPMPSLYNTLKEQPLIPTV